MLMEWQGEMGWDGDKFIVASSSQRGWESEFNKDWSLGPLQVNLLHNNNVN